VSRRAGRHVSSTPQGLATRTTTALFVASVLNDWADAVTQRAWLGLVPKQISPATAPSLARYRNAATATCVFYSFRPRGLYSSSRRAGIATGSSRGSKRPRSGCITTSSPSHSPTSSLALLGASWLMVEHSRQPRFRLRDLNASRRNVLPAEVCETMKTRWRIGLSGACEHW
jgi:hypothetical protein